MCPFRMSCLNDIRQLKDIRAIAKKRKIPIYLVGGFLRDLFLDRECCDFDFALEKNAILFARTVAKKIKGAFILLDDEHGCARVAKKFKGKIFTFDFADFRADSLKKDLGLRDFTINTLCLDLTQIDPDADFKDNVLDMKSALKDMKAKRIKMVSSKVFKDDPLRLMRAFSLKANLGFSIEDKTKQQIKKDNELIRDVSRERVRDELFKILESPRAASNLRAMDRAGLLEKIIPQVRVMFGFKQGPYHHLDVWKHSLESVYQFEKIIEKKKHDEELMTYLSKTLGGGRSRLALIKLACVLHDIGKPDSFRKEQERFIFHGHEKVGKSIVRNIAKQLKLSTRERFILCDMVFWHLRPGYLSNFKKPSEKAVFRYMRDTKDEAVSVALLCLADQKSTCGPLTLEEDQIHHEAISWGLIDRYFAKKKEKPFVRLINGDDLIKVLKLAPSPIFTEILQKIEEEQATGKISTKKDALEIAKKFAEKLAK